MKHIITTLLLFGLTFSVEAQVYLGEMDSIIVKRYYYRDKELSRIGSTEDDKDIFEELSSEKLTHRQEKILQQKLKQKKSYYNQRALLNHFDISILFYKYEKEVFRINYSSLTNNLTIYKRVDEEDYDYDDIYRGQATPYLYRFLNKL
ncbi:hypothetical protein JMN11_03895 [Capnocytophaga genosp. AHN8471]|uniref:hypothetical protein n=1 Tax=Capnocytophaga genosp. AHN8471 TaxID=327574 RepID=UPI001933FD97|nr:hypothetical protein [Capnocytophaga genosp. AHN8471]MBM0652823.1 hypothetical protein [Capnocytophaga genosp. AHN8471]MBM0659547.1 hypothetical protein [Capnocytophaga genosp. AHN8471]